MFWCIGQVDFLTGITICVSENNHLACVILKSEEIEYEYRRNTNHLL